MKRLLILASLILMIVPSVDARKKRDKAGEIDNDLYTDKAYGFQLKMNEDWKVKINEADDPMRLVLVQKNYLIPTDYSDAPDYTKVPRIVVYADTSSLPASTFIDSLVSQTYDSEQTKEIKKEFEILWEKDIIPQREERIEIAGERGAIWRARAKYVKEVATSANSLGGKRVYSSYGGAIIGVKKGDTIILFHVMSEWQYFNDIFNDAMEFVQSLSWAEGKK